MKLQEIYNLILKMGIDHDPRGIEVVQKQLAKEKKKIDELKEDERKEIDQDRIFNPYSDTRVLFGELDREVKRILVGIDMEVGEVILADRLAEKGKKIDLIMAHHPEGKAMAGLYDVMHLQEDLLAQLGVPVNVAEGIMAGRIGEVRRGLMPVNHNRAVDAARLLDIPLMCCHTPADNMVTEYVQKKIDENNCETLGDIVKVLKEIPEYAAAVKTGAGPTIVVGSRKRSAGKVFVDMTGGTSGSEDAYSKLSVAGVGTLVVMHISEKHRKEAEKNHVNVIIAGHMASDSLGMNLILDMIEQRGVEILTCSGLIRVKRS
ncbi:NGG1p interacting factor NIF3 [Desulfotomaculum sp. 1211_IL3151]|uniref:NGG1p interacting factor NIF3 n=1 Tax=Desulfotomaculum sp. 1211_IL3151 TaxID=3084055 RepID=UPI002FDA6955